MRIYRDYWDPTYISESSTINQKWTTFIQPKKHIPFRIPRMRAILNMIYPGTPLSFTEWSAAFAGESDFSTALADADAYGILGRERMYLASRWVAPVATNPNYQALKLYRNYDGQHDTFATTSVSATNDGNPDLFSSYAALNSTGTTLTLMVINKRPLSTVQAQFTVSGFTPQQVTTYTLSPKSPTKIVASSPKGMEFLDEIRALHRHPLGGDGLDVCNAERRLGSESGYDHGSSPRNNYASAEDRLWVRDRDPRYSAVGHGNHIGGHAAKSYLHARRKHHGDCGHRTRFLSLYCPKHRQHWRCRDPERLDRCRKSASDVHQNRRPSGGQPGSQLNLSVTLHPGRSGGSAAGGTVLFTTNGGTLSNRIVNTDSNGNAPVVLTLPANSGTVHVTAEGQFGLGHPVATFTETVE